MERLKFKIAVYIIIKNKNKVLLGKRFQTGWQDGNYGLPSGHLEEGEDLFEAIKRESKEEVGINLKVKDLKLIQVMHRKDYLDFFFSVKEYKGTPKIKEPDKCDGLEWFDINKLPKNTVPSVKKALENYKKKVFISTFRGKE